MMERMAVQNEQDKGDDIAPAADATLFIASNKLAFESALHQLVIESCQASIDARGVFCIALSGGSVPSFLCTLPQSFQQRSVNPHFDKWHICLADERMVPYKHPDSNHLSILNASMGWSSLDDDILQIYGIDEKLLLTPIVDNNSTNLIALSYENKVMKPLLLKSNGTLDCIVLGFGPDGHTCSLFPDHPLAMMNDQQQLPLVAAVQDSPKPPSRRITLTFPVVNSSKSIIMCGAGSSKKDIVRHCFQQPITTCIGNNYADATNSLLVGKVHLQNPSPYPCTTVRPTTSAGKLSWILDSEAVQDLQISRV